MHVAFLSLLLAALPTQDPLVFRSYSVSHLTRRIEDAFSLRPFARHLPSYGDSFELRPGEWLRDPRPLIAEEELVELIRNVFLPGRLPEGWFIDEERGRIYVQTDAATHDRIADFLRHLDERIRSERVRITVRAYELEGPFESSTSWLDGQKRQAMRSLLESQSEVRFVEQALLEPDRRARFGKQREHRIVHDLDVAVAQESATAEPIVGAIRYGSEIALYTYPLQGEDSVLVQVHVDEGLTPRFRRLALGHEGLGSLELPEMECRTLQFHARVPLGGALVVPVARVEGQSVIYLIEVDPAAPRPPSLKDVTFFPVRHLDRGNDLAVLWPPDLEEPLPRDEFDSSPLVDLDRLQEGILRAHPEAFDEGSARLELRGRWFVLHGADQAVTQTTRNILTKVENEEARTAHLRLEIHRAARDREDPVETSRALGYLELFARRGLTSRAAVGQERLMLADHAVEIAQDSALHDPVVLPVFLGTWLELAPHHLGADSANVQVHLNARTPLALPQLVAGPLAASPMEGLVHEEVDLLTNVDLALDRPVLLGSLPDGPNGEPREAWLRLVAIH